MYDRYPFLLGTSETITDAGPSLSLNLHLIAELLMKRAAERRDRGDPTTENDSFLALARKLRKVSRNGLEFRKFASFRKNGCQTGKARGERRSAGRTAVGGVTNGLVG